MLSKAPKILHISCHGISNSEFQEQEGDFLLFEDEHLIGELISKKKLQNLISNVEKTDLVFLAACSSEFVAKIFLRKGVRHVIFIENMKEVLDKAVLTFTNTFYRTLFDGKTICEAFQIAQRLTVNLHSERDALIFKLVTRTENHECLPIEFS
jgi:CHAT domain-containing protein